MGNHPNRNWRSKWAVDPSTCTVTHQSGLIVEYTLNDGGWDGEIISELPELSNNAKDAQIIANKFARLMREAGDIYKEHLDRKN